MLNSCAINKVILMGRLTQNPELRQTQGGSSNCRFTLAVDRGVGGSNNERLTDFITVVAWDKNAEFVCRYLTKGRLVLIEGNLKTGSYDDRNHPDVKHYTCEVFAERVSFGETKSSVDHSSSSYGTQQYSQPAQTQNDQQSYTVGDLSDFEEVIGNGELPF